ncbi:MAG TPA: aminotransferase class V-fold PLP-dependent enzyme [Candidatus Nanopelagicaceae bacterium]|nr:aminotransferase class V-fold PLP-dependent enzyme [Candidatus Nanopelagicaceae bacterium]
MKKPLNLGIGRDAALKRATEIVAKAWDEFYVAREHEPRVEPALAATLRELLPEAPMDPIQTLNLAAEVLDTSLAHSRPRFMAWIGSSGLEIGALGDLLAHSYDINLAIDSRAASALERQTLRWLGEFVGFPVGGGAFTSGGTISNITALAAAREVALPGSRKHGVMNARPAIYCSAEVHYSVRRGVELLGLGSDCIRAIPIDADHRIHSAALAESLETDLRDGIVPVAVIATSGTTLTGAIDPIGEIADICQRFNVWLHVDGAYGLPAAGVPSKTPAFSGIDRADSVSVDAHKWMFVPKACSALMVKDRKKLAATFSHNESYMLHDGETGNAVDETLEYSRPLRALKLWLAFKTHGAEEFRSAIQANLDQAQKLYDTADADPRFEVLPFRPELSVVPVRYGKDTSDEFQSLLVQKIQEDGRVFVSAAEIEGRIWMRPCFTNFRTTEEDALSLLEVAADVAESLRL